MSFFFVDFEISLYLVLVLIAHKIFLSSACSGTQIFHFPWATRMVIAVFYTNIFLVLGDYILVMAHAVQAFVGEGSICLPTAGLLASTLMFGFSQLRTMSHIGRSVTFLSLACLTVVVVQCLVAAEHNEPASGTYAPPSETSVLRKFSALASIGFATGSNKLLVGPDSLKQVHT